MQYPSTDNVRAFVEEWWHSIGVFDEETNTLRPVLDDVHPEHFVDFAIDVLAEFDYQAPCDD